MIASTKPLSILVADDVTEIHDLVAHWLRACGHRIATAATGSDALRLLRREAFDLVIADVLMPDGDGLDIIRELKSHPAPPRVLAISGGGKYLPAPDCIRLAETLGAHAVLLKPFDERQLLAAVGRAFDGASPRRDPTAPG